MSLSRIFRVTVVCFVLLAVAVPALQARTFDTSPRGVSPADGSWLAASLSWLGQLFGVEKPVPQIAPKTDTTTTTTTISGTLKPTTGACIDPLGKPWCSI